MKTELDYLDEVDFEIREGTCYSKAGILNAMSEHAQEVAIAFAKFMEQSAWTRYGEDTWVIHRGTKPTVKTSQELFSTFIKEMEK